MDIEGLIHTCRSDCVPGLGHPRVSRVSAVCGGAVPPVGEDRYPPALHLAEASVRELDVQGQLGDPDCHFQGGSEDVVAKGDPGIHGPARLLSANKDVVTAAGYLGRGREVGWHISPYRSSCRAVQGTAV